MNLQLFAYFTDIRNQIIEIATQKGMNASGKTLTSLEITEIPNGLELMANSNIYFMENGRGPTHPGTPAGNPNLVEVIQNWLDAKGLAINPYAVANAIHKNGTRLYRSGGNSGVLSIPLKLERLDEVFANISAEYLQTASQDIFKPMLEMGQ
ncbi:hypothetical protein BDD43_5152 [Mucilaginibacter gracilis]|uniref:Uncharacterized protein n=1 Tax=Mucilaginibacter gracilis TaxID=423350 RepID=A0A495JA08_9SPHI|nr:hypothetical protein [Mucilaginibacter gracilis]RKR84899.1 hypothetical protein BDD43_5152 [Mucilaginibacter gracilis]